MQINCQRLGPLLTHSLCTTTPDPHLHKLGVNLDPGPKNHRCLMEKYLASSAPIRRQFIKTEQNVEEVDL